jgi:hypothetical protein
MTIQTVQIHTFDYGASLSSATLRNVATDALVATADTVNEVTADSGVYAAVFDEASVISAGEYRLRAVVGGQPINRYVTLGGTNNEVAQARSERLAVLDSAVGTQITNIENAAGYTLAVLAGACADPQTASETYTITLFGSTFTVDMAGQTGTGTRTAPTLTKT